MATVKKIKKAQRGGCLSTTSSSERTRIYKQAAGEGSANRAYRREERQAARAERQEARAERRAARKAAPEAKAGKTVKKAQSGAKVIRDRVVSSEMTPGKKISKAAQDKRTDSMAKSLDKASVLGSKFRRVVRKKSGGEGKRACWGSRMK